MSGIGQPRYRSVDVRKVVVIAEKVQLLAPELKDSGDVVSEQASQVMPNYGQSVADRNIGSLKRVGLEMFKAWEIAIVCARQ